MRTETLKIEHQGALSVREIALAVIMKRNPKKFFSTLEICRITGCVSARDRIRKLKANGAKIGKAKFLRKSRSGANIFGWRVAA